MFFLGTLKWVKFAGFFDGCPEDPMVGPHTDCVVSWDTVVGIQPLGGLQGAPQTGFVVAQDGRVGVLAVLQGKFGWEMVKILKVGFCPTPGALGIPKQGPIVIVWCLGTR